MLDDREILNSKDILLEDELNKHLDKNALSSFRGYLYQYAYSIRLINKILKGSIDAYVYENYEDFKSSYTKVLQQKIELEFLKPIECSIAPKAAISKKDIEGIAVLDNYDIKRELKDRGLVQRALKDWDSLGDEYNAKLFFKTNVLDPIFFMDYQIAANLIREYRRNI